MHSVKKTVKVLHRINLYVKAKVIEKMKKANEFKNYLKNKAKNFVYFTIILRKQYHYFKSKNNSYDIYFK